MRLRLTIISATLASLLSQGKQEGSSTSRFFSQISLVEVVDGAGEGDE